MKKRNLFTLILFVCFGFSIVKAQITISDDLNYTAHPSTILDIYSLEGGVRIPGLTYAQRDSIENPALGLLVFCLSDSIFYYSTGDTWLPIIGTKNFVNHYAGNTLDNAYDQGGAGEGRIVKADAGPVEIKGFQSNNALVIKDAEANGANTKKLLSIKYKGNKSAQEILHHHKGSAMFVENDTAIDQNIANNIAIKQNSGSTNPRNADGGRAIYGVTKNAANNKPVIEGSNLGVGHGVLGISGFNNAPPYFFKELPIAGVAGFSGTSGPPLKNGEYEGYIDGLGTSVQKARIGVAGLSYGMHGVFGGTYSHGNYNSTKPDTIIAGIKGTGQYFTGLSGNITQFDHFAVAGVSEKHGVGLLGIGGGHGVVGLSGTKKDASMAGVWGNTRDGSWETTKTAYPLRNNVANKGKVGVIGTSRDEFGIWGEGKERIGIIATAGKQFSTKHIPALKKIGLFASAANGVAGRFISEIDTTTQKGKMQVDLAIESGNAIYTRVDSSANKAGVVIKNLGKENALEIDMNFPELGNLNNLQKTALDIDHKSFNSSAVMINHDGGETYAVYVRNKSSNAGILSRDSASIGIVGATEKGSAGIQGIAIHDDPKAAALHGIGGGHKDAAAALELTTGVVSVSGPVQKRTAGKMIDQSTIPGQPLFGWNEIKTGKASPFCASCNAGTGGCHSHPIGFYKDYTVTNDLLSADRSLVFLQPTAHPNWAAATFGLTDYESITAHILQLSDGSMKVRVSIITGIKNSFECPSITNDMILIAPTIVKCNYFIINETAE